VASIPGVDVGTPASSVGADVDPLSADVSSLAAVVSSLPQPAQSAMIATDPITARLTGDRFDLRMLNRPSCPYTPPSCEVYAMARSPNPETRPGLC
jgi:hypothetical protein